MAIWEAMGPDRGCKGRCEAWVGEVGGAGTYEGCSAQASLEDPERKYHFGGAAVRSSVRSGWLLNVEAGWGADRT